MGFEIPSCYDFKKDENVDNFNLKGAKCIQINRCCGYSK
jgi:hypothetical protein